VDRFRYRRRKRARVNANYSIYGTDAFGNTFAGSNSFSNTRVGWTVGGGIQYAVTNNWWVFAEYRYTNFGTINNELFPGLASFDPAITGGSISASRQLTENQVQVGFSYKFDLYGPGPVVAKY